MADVRLPLEDVQSSNQDACAPVTETEAAASYEVAKVDNSMLKTLVAEAKLMIKQEEPAKQHSNHLDQNGNVSLIKDHKANTKAKELNDRNGQKGRGSATTAAAASGFSFASTAAPMKSESSVRFSSTSSREVQDLAAAMRRLAEQHSMVSPPQGKCSLWAERLAEQFVANLVPFMSPSPWPGTCSQQMLPMQIFATEPFHTDWKIPVKKILDARTPCVSSPFTVQSPYWTGEYSFLLTLKPQNSADTLKKAKGRGHVELKCQQNPGPHISFCVTIGATVIHGEHAFTTGCYAGLYDHQNPYDSCPHLWDFPALQDPDGFVTIKLAIDMQPQPRY